MDPNLVTLGTMDMSKCVNPETHPFRVPQRAVTSFEAMEVWLKSEAYLEYMGFITAMNREVRGKPLSVPCPESEVTIGMLSLLEKLDVWITETPPIQQPQRFGNKAFKTWYTKVKENALESLQEALPAKFHRAVPEIKEYFTESFGNSTRIDYGTGHEMSFCMFLCCLFKIGAFSSNDNLAVTCKIFNRYMILVRRLQTVYKMEPAGSRGVWALDDYQFIPFIWGSSQLIDHPRIEPRSFLQSDIVNTFAKDYMFLGCIKYINEVKTGPFAEHSNQLWNISGVGYWAKVNEGLIKMYKAEVLAKFPVVQHVLFGSLLPLVIAPLPPINLFGKRPQGRQSKDSMSRPSPSGFSKPEPKTPPTSITSSVKNETKSVASTTSPSPPMQDDKFIKCEEKHVSCTRTEKPEGKNVGTKLEEKNVTGTRTETLMDTDFGTKVESKSIASTRIEKPEDANGSRLENKSMASCSTRTENLEGSNFGAKPDSKSIASSHKSDKSKDKNFGTKLEEKNVSGIRTETPMDTDFGTKLESKSIASAKREKPEDASGTRLESRSMASSRAENLQETDFGSKPENKNIASSHKSEKPEDKNIGTKLENKISTKTENLEDVNLGTKVEGKDVTNTRTEETEDNNIGNDSKSFTQTSPPTTTVAKHSPSQSHDNLT